jgi:hypothetical protein
VSCRMVFFSCCVVLLCLIMSCLDYVPLCVVLCHFKKKIDTVQLKHWSKTVLYCTVSCPMIMSCRSRTVPFCVVLNHGRLKFRTQFAVRRYVRGSLTTIAKCTQKCAIEWAFHFARKLFLDNYDTQCQWR